MSELSPKARAFLESARNAHAPTAGDRARVREALGARLAAAAVATTASQTAMAAPKTLIAKLTLAKVIAGVVLVGAVSAVTVLQATRPVDRASPAAHAALPTTVSRGTHAPGASTDQAASASHVVLAPPVIVEPVRETAPIPAVSRPRNALHARPVIATAPAIVNAPEVNAEPVPPAPIAANSLRAELVLVRGAQESLRVHDASHALTLLDEHAAQFPDGVLREERNAARVLALCALDRAPEARIAAAVLLREAPNSPYANRVRGSCAGVLDASPAPSESH